VDESRTLMVYGESHQFSPMVGGFPVFGR